MLSVKRSGVVLVVAAVVGSAAVADAALVGTKPVSSPQTNGRVDAIAISGSTAYIAGEFTTVTPTGGGAVTRDRATAVNLATGAVTAFNPNVSGTVEAIAVSGNIVFLGGSFTKVGSTAVDRLVAVDATTGAIVWKATMNKQVTALAVNGSTLYAGGYFTTANGANRSYLAAFNTSTGALSTTWQPQTNLEVKALAVTASGSTVVIGGDFSTLNGSSANHLGAVSATTGASVTWHSHEPFDIISLAADANGVYAGGGGSGGNFAAFNPSNGAALWKGGTDGNIQAITVLGGVVYVGGHFLNYCNGQSGQHTCAAPIARDHLLAVDEGTGSLLSWDPTANSVLGVFALNGSGTTLTIGGDFTKIGGVSQQGFAVFNP